MIMRSLLLLILLSASIFPTSSSYTGSIEKQAATLLVTSSADSGPGTLRQALLDAQNGDTIQFDPTAFPTTAPTAIFLISELPSITQNQLTIDASEAGVILDGSTAPSGNGLTLLASECVIRGLTIRTFPANGIYLGSGASDNTIGGDRTAGDGPNGQGNTIIQNGANGIDLQGPNTDSNQITGNYIGIEASGLWAAGNTYSGISIYGEARQNLIGGTTLGLRNVIGGNAHNGVWIGGTGADENIVIGNYIGTRADGLAAIGNHQSGVSIPDGAQNNSIGGIAPGEGNLISGNWDYGIFISDPGTDGNQVYGNLIGLDKDGEEPIGQGSHGIIIRSGAQNNSIGDAPNGGNIISGNGQDGMRIEGSETTNNAILGNYIGTDLNGIEAIPNGLHGVDIADEAHNNQIGMAGRGNLISGNNNHGLVISSGAHHNTVMANIIGPDVSGTTSLGYQDFGGIDIAEGASHNIIGGLGAGEGNLISGNGLDGIALFSNTSQETRGNQILGNRIGLALTGDVPLPNPGDGIFNVSRAYETHIEGNTIAYNGKSGIWSIECGGSTITRNSIYQNGGVGIQSNCVPAPQASAISTDTITGQASAGARIEIFSDDEFEGQYYEGYTLADASGIFTFTQPGGFVFPNLSATSTEADGDTSPFSRPVHTLWTLLLYLNGDNDLAEVMFDILDNLGTHEASQYANVIALIDGSPISSTGTYSGTALYNLSYGQAIPIPATLSGTISVPGELNMGDGQILDAFAHWGRTHYPASYTMLAIIDHGGGWAPGTEEMITNVHTTSILSRRHRHHFFAGGSGLSWDFTSEYDYLDMHEVQRSLADITQNGADPLDIVFFDVCLMGLGEVAYQIKDYAGYYVAAQNLGWAPLGPESRYIQLIESIQSTTTPELMTASLVDTYVAATPPEGHPITISAVDLSQMEALRDAVDQLSLALSNTLNNQATFLKQAYLASQKFDYDTDFVIEPDSDGFVDLYDFALQAKAQYIEPAVDAAADQVMTVLDAAVVAEKHRSGHPWMAPELTWTLDNAHGISLFLPLGEDLILPITTTSEITPGLVITQYKHLYESYTASQLDFVRDTHWGEMIAEYYAIVESPIPTDTTRGPLKGLLMPDVVPPYTVITITGIYTAGNEIAIQWSASDLGSGVSGAELWHQALGEEWRIASSPQSGLSGTFTFGLTTGCTLGLAVRGIDKAQNFEAYDDDENNTYLYVDYCTQLPLILKNRRR